MAERLTADGLPTTRSSVARAFRRNDLTPPLLSVESGGVSKVQERLQRAERAVDGSQTKEDRLQDELDHARAELRAAGQTIQRLRSAQVLEDRIEAVIAASLQEFEYTPILAAPRDLPPSATDAMLLFSDAHFGEKVDPDQTLGIKYDPEVARRRIERLRDEVLTIRGGLGGKLVVACLGDNIGGMIHPELEVTNALGMVDQCRDMAHIMFDFLSTLAEEIEHVEAVIIPGNHPRAHHKPRYKQRSENWETVMGEMVKGFVQYAEVPRLDVYVPRQYPYVHEVGGKRVAMIHGDGIKSNSFAGIPFYGMRQQREAVQSLMSMTGQDRVDMFVMGHWHQHLEWPGECDIVINGSIKGADEYSIGTRLAANAAEQVLLEIDPSRQIGSVTKHRIYLGDVE